MSSTNSHILITGAAGYIGSQLTVKLGDEILSGNRSHGSILAMDVQPPPVPHPKVVHVRAVNRSRDLEALLRKYKINTVVHLASTALPPQGLNRKRHYAQEKEGMENLLKACVAARVKRIVVTTNGTGYTKLTEYREQHPELEQVIFRVGTILGENVANQITALFEKRFVLRIAGSESPFAFVWDQDVIHCLLKAMDSDQTGVYSVAGDGFLSLRYIAMRLGKPLLTLPGILFKTGRFFLKKLQLSRSSPVQTRFFPYGSALSGENLDSDFQYTPRMNSLETFEYFLQSKRT